MNRSPQHLLSPDVTRRLAGPAGWSLALRVVAAALALAVSILLARLLGPEGYGVYAFALAVVMLLALPTQAGLPTLLVREVARYDADGDWSRLTGLLRRGNQAVALLALAVASVAAVIAIARGSALSAEERATFLWALCLVPLYSLGNLRGAALRGLRRVISGQFPEYVVRPGVFAGCLLASLAVFGTAGGPDGGIGPAEAMALHASAALVAFLVGVALLRGGLPDAARSAARRYDSRTWLRSLLPLTLLAGISMINNQMDVVLLGLLSTDAEVGIYRAALSASMPVVFALSAVNLVVAPHFSRLFAGGDLAGLQRLVTWSARVAAGVAVPAGLLLALFGTPLLGFVFGEPFAAGGAALAILVAGQLVNAMAGSVGNLLNMTGHERETVLGVGVAAAANLALNVALIPSWGMEGAATATAASLVVWNVLLVVRARRRLGIASVAWHRGPPPAGLP